MFKRILIGLATAIVATVALAADVKISAEPAMSALGATDIFLGNQGGVTGTATAAQMATYVMAAPPAAGFGSTTPRPVAATTISATGQITSTLAIGTAPFAVTSTTNVANLNASSLSGATFAAPGAIGSGTPAAGAFTTLSSSSGMALSSLATQATNTVAGNATSGTAVPTALAVGTCSTSSSALKWTTNTGFGCNTAINAATSTGVIDASAAAAGVVGEVVSVHCVVGAAAAAASAVTITIATPGVVTWSGFPVTSSASLANYSCPINFTGTPPTGLAVGTTYYIVGATVSGNTFSVADTAAHALANTNKITTTGSDGGTTAYIGAVGASTTAFAAAAVQLVAGDWDCSGLAEFQELTSITSTEFANAIDTTTVVSTIGQSADMRTVTGSIGTTSFYLPTPVVQRNISATTTTQLVDKSTFSGGTMNEGGLLRCRRMR